MIETKKLSDLTLKRITKSDNTFEDVHITYVPSNIISNRGIAGVFNLYAKQFISSVSKAMPKVIAKQTAKGLAMNGVNNIITSFLSAIFS